MLKLMYITNRPEVAKIVDEAGIDRIFIDMEYIGKSLRQGGMDTVQSHHTIDDVKKVKEITKNAEIVVRCNPIHQSTNEYSSSQQEINDIINNGADVVMLPFFKTVEEVEKFIKFVNGRAKTLLLLETPEAVDCLDEILQLDGINEIHVGLNDLSLGYKKKFMFELLADGTVENLCNKFKERNIPYGFGGIASLGKGLLPSEKVIAEHYRLGSTCAILSRSFCNANVINDLNEVKRIFTVDLKAIRDYENKCANGLIDLEKNRIETVLAVNKIKQGLK